MVVRRGQASNTELVEALIVADEKFAAELERDFPGITRKTPSAAVYRDRPAALRGGTPQVYPSWKVATCLPEDAKVPPRQFFRVHAAGHVETIDPHTTQTPAQKEVSYAL